MSVRCDAFIRGRLARVYALVVNASCCVELQQLFGDCLDTNSLLRPKVARGRAFRWVVSRHSGMRLEPLWMFQHIFIGPIHSMSIIQNASTHGDRPVYFGLELSFTCVE